MHSDCHLFLFNRNVVFPNVERKCQTELDKNSHNDFIKSLDLHLLAGSFKGLFVYEACNKDLIHIEANELMEKNFFQCLTIHFQ